MMIAGSVSRAMNYMLLFLVDLLLVTLALLLVR
jgi:hypothetical protein